MRAAIVCLCIAIACIVVVFIGNIGFIGQVVCTFTALMLSAYGCNEWEEFNKKGGVQ